MELGSEFSEAVGLSVGEVDLEHGLLTIRRTKFYKTRLVGLGADLCKALKQYRCELKPKSHPENTGDAFFTCRNGSPVTHNLIRNAFVRLRKYVAVKREDVKQQPRLHDLRHTLPFTDSFPGIAAVRTFNVCFRCLPHSLDTSPSSRRGTT